MRARAGWISCRLVLRFELFDSPGEVFEVEVQSANGFGVRAQALVNGAGPFVELSEQ